MYCVSWFGIKLTIYQNIVKIYYFSCLTWMRWNLYETMAYLELACATAAFSLNQKEMGVAIYTAMMSFREIAIKQFKVIKFIWLQFIVSSVAILWDKSMLCLVYRICDGKISSSWLVTENGVCISKAKCVSIVV